MHATTGQPTACIAAGDDELYQAQRPLPLAELHSGRSNGGGGGGGAGGVLCLLKMALWHALWVEVAPSPGRLAGWCIGLASGLAQSCTARQSFKAGRQGCASLLGVLPDPPGCLPLPRLQAAGRPRRPHCARSSRRQQVRGVPANPWKPWACLPSSQSESNPAGKPERVQSHLSPLSLTLHSVCGCRARPACPVQAS